MIKLKQETNIRFEFSDVDCVVKNINLYTTEIQFKNSDDKEEVERILRNNKVVRLYNDIEDTDPATLVITGSIIADYSSNKLTLVHKD